MKGMDMDKIIVKGAREHNLKDIDLILPKNRFIVFTGVSGSGKSSMAFDTLYAEGQRRYIESLSAYARQFMGRIQKPDVESIEGLSPSISIDQKTTGSNPRSTVATMTEIHDYLRLLFAYIGKIYCYRCGALISDQSTDEIVERIMNEIPDRRRFMILSPVARSKKGEFKDEFKDALKAGFVRVRVDGEIYDLSNPPRLNKQMRHDVDIVVDRIVMRKTPEMRGRLAESLETAFGLSEGVAVLLFEDGEERMFSRSMTCLNCGISYTKPSPQLFSFNSPQGMCPKCRGLGVIHDISPHLIVDPEKSISQGAIKPIGPLRFKGESQLEAVLTALAKYYKFSFDRKWKDLPQEHRDIILYGAPVRIMITRRIGWGRRIKQIVEYKGIINKLRRYSDEELRGYISESICPDCNGSRLRPEARGVKVGGKAIHEITAMTVDECLNFFENLDLTERERTIAEEILKEIKGRLRFLVEVGLHYLTLDRSSPTLSGGEAQRIRLASQIGAGLTNVLYVLDEPTIGLHQRDNQKLIKALKKLRDQGNTVIVVEHDEETIRSADYIVDFGPGPGEEGGEIVFAGPAGKILECPNSLTAKYLRGELEIPIPSQRRKPSDKWLTIVGARHNNLKNITVKIPLGTFTCITGVSGSGKSSLVDDIIYKALARKLMGAHTVPGEHDRIDGIEHIDKVIEVDQSPIGRTPRSNPATYTKLFDAIRSFYAELPESKIRGYKPGRFSFNVRGGRCEACQGHGMKKIEMHFLADVWVRCEVCDGRRYNRETLQVRYNGKSIADVLDMTVGEALKFFENVPRIRRYLQTLYDVGLDYIKLGQPAPTLSGGEAQRVKLARELSKRSTGRTFYILDEPTRGLHFADVQKLLNVLHTLVDRGNTVVVVEHNMEIIKTADYVIDLGPEGGEEGGYVVACGTPEEVAEVESSYTGKVLKEVLMGRHKPMIEEMEEPIRSLPAERAILVRGARQNNLKNVDLTLPHDELITFTGVSGSGKTSMAIETIYAEGRRRYVESLSTYARQFLGGMDKPKVDFIEGLAPAIAIDQKAPSKNPRSTVGTITEIYDYLRVLFARFGVQHCVKCGRPVGAQTVDQIVDRIMALPSRSRIYILAPVKLARNEEYADVFKRAQREGFVRVWVDGEISPIEEKMNISRRVKHEVAIVVDRLILREDQRGRISEGVETALEMGEGEVRVQLQRPDTTTELLTFSSLRACARCGISYDELRPQDFSFNSPVGMCPYCEGLGFTDFSYMSVCPKCQGARIKESSRYVLINDKNIAELCRMSIGDLYQFFLDLKLPQDKLEVGGELLREIRNRLSFLVDIGLHYLTLDRPGPTLSGGEAQRIRLASQLGSGLTGVIYVLDEPTIGLHMRDTGRLLKALRKLRDLGNTVITVEHDREVISNSDLIVDFGPGAGLNGGRIVAKGRVQDIRRIEESLTGRYLANRFRIEVPKKRRSPKGFIRIIGAYANNLKDIDVGIPLGVITCITGVSGSGKSSLVEEVLYPAVARYLDLPAPEPKCLRVKGLGGIDKVINVNQKPIGETPRSNPATYTGVFDHIRTLFARTPDARAMGFTASYFSSNLEYGRCPSCDGEGYNLFSMPFLPDVWVKCEVCDGTGFMKEILEIRYKGKNISEVLKMTVAEAREFFKDIPRIRRILDVLCDVGLDYMPLGQPATTLSGGEAQRLKLARELIKPDTGKTLYIMDEPTTGLHAADIKRLLDVLNRLADKGNTIVVIEHNMDVIKCADYIIDLGPEGGDEGGYLVACGTPEEVAGSEISHTGRFLRDFLV